jgi:Domain of unknown function (DUF4266)
VHWLCFFKKGGPRGGMRATLLGAADRAASPSPLSPEFRPGKAEPKFHRFILGAVVLGILGLGGGGCAVSKWTVKPHQRELLADRIMQLDAEGQERAAEEHILSNREGAVGGTGTSGGGCGCN